MTLLYHCNESTHNEKDRSTWSGAILENDYNWFNLPLITLTHDFTSVLCGCCWAGHVGTQDLDRFEAIFAAVLGSRNFENQLQPAIYSFDAPTAPNSIGEQSLKVR